jgi:hypothetical protein
MTLKRAVKIFWYPAEEKGRKAPPTGPKYFAVYKPKSAEVPDQDWSVQLELTDHPDHKYCRDAMLSFVSKEAPVSSLRPGHTFYLFEGRWPVAEGVVLQVSETDV